MSIETTKAVVRRYLDVMINGGDTSIADEPFAAGYVNHTVGSGIVTGGEGMARGIRAVKTAFPDWHVSIDAMVAEGDLVVDRFTISATHRLGQWHRSYWTKDRHARDAHVARHERQTGRGVVTSPMRCRWWQGRSYHRRSHRIEDRVHAGRWSSWGPSQMDSSLHSVCQVHWSVGP